MGSTGISPLVAAVTVFRDSRSATTIFHGKSTRASGERGVPPVPGWRRKAILRPSADHAGNESREVEGATKRIDRSTPVNNPIKLWSPRLEPNASVFPSVDHVGDSLERAASNACLG